MYEEAVKRDYSRIFNFNKPGTYVYTQETSRFDIFCSILYLSRPRKLKESCEFRPDQTGTPCLKIPWHPERWIHTVGWTIKEPKISFHIFAAKTMLCIVHQKIDKITLIYRGERVAGHETRKPTWDKRRFSIRVVAKKYIWYAGGL